MKYYYLINGTVKVSYYKIPKIEIGESFYEFRYRNWEESLQPCEIDESEIMKIYVHLFPNLSYNKQDFTPIDITDIVLEKDGKIYFKNNDMELSALQKHRKTWVGKSDEWLFERLNNELKSKIETIHDLLNQIDTNNSFHAINFTEWVCDNWIKDPFPRKEFDDDIIRYTNIGSIYGEEELKIYTIKELYEIFCIEVLGIKSKEKNVNKDNIIPPMTHPYGKHWQQPELSEVVICDKYATMNQAAFKKLLDYSRSRPSGVYEGKMWKTSDDKITWHLHWWSESDNPDKCKGNVREIKIKD